MLRPHFLCALSPNTKLSGIFQETNSLPGSFVKYFCFLVPVVSTLTDSIPYMLFLLLPGLGLNILRGRVWWFGIPIIQPHFKSIGDAAVCYPLLALIFCFFFFMKRILTLVRKEMTCRTKGKFADSEEGWVPYPHAPLPRTNGSLKSWQGEFHLVTAL